MASVVGICNIALSNIGDEKISSLTDNNDRARACNLRYEDTRDAVLRAHPWNAATTRVELAVSTDAPVWGFTYKYALPSDCLRVLDVLDYTVPFSIEGRFLLTDNSTAKLKYIARITDPNVYDILLQQAIGIRLAAEIAEALTGRTELKQEMYNKYLLILSEARGVDSQEKGMPMVIEANDFINARFDTSYLLNTSTTI
tara:strand:+ start:378 stop:974 length:597 start_codon:yes stop_codon:yes gene_type:complete